MPRITFTQDVTLPNEKGGPHYTRGYSPDVSDDEARKWVKAGKAVLGEVKLEAEPEKEPPFVIPTFKRRRQTL